MIKFFIKLVLKNVIELTKGSLKNIFQDLFNKILSQQLTHDRSYMSHKLHESSTKIPDTDMFILLTAGAGDTKPAA